MKAAAITTTGPASVIQYADIPQPEPANNQVLIEMGAVAVNPIDIYIRSGSINAALPSPYVIGCDIAGTVIAVGADVSKFQIGDRVWGSNQGLAGRQGTFSEYAVVDECWLYPTPDNVTDEQAAAIALTGITAHLGLLLHADLQPGETVFVNGGTGGVGSAVVQIAKAVGATTITTVGSAEKAEAAGALGADHVINYRDTNVAAELATLTDQIGGINVWFETLRTPSPDATLPLLAKRGRYLLMAGRDARPEWPVGAFYINDLRAIGFAMFNASSDEQLDAANAINQLMAAGKLKALIGANFSLADAHTAHQLQEDNTLQGAGTLTGKIVLTP